MTETNEVRRWRQRRNEQYENDENRMKVRYKEEHSEALLDAILKLSRSVQSDCKLHPCYLLCMFTEYSAVKFDQMTTRRLLLKMTNLVRNEVWVSVWFLLVLRLLGGLYIFLYILHKLQRISSVDDEELLNKSKTFIRNFRNNPTVWQRSRTQGKFFFSNFDVLACLALCFAEQWFKRCLFLFSEASFPDNVREVAPLVLWLSNSLELLHYFQQNLYPDLLLDPEVSLPAGSRRSLVDAEEESLAALEEVATYTFQQTVYYLTKVHVGKAPSNEIVQFRTCGFVLCRIFYTFLEQ